MKLIKYLLLYLLAVFQPELFGQTVTGKLVDHYGAGLNRVQLKLYLGHSVFETITSVDGSFTFENVVKSEIDGALPAGYEVSEFYPNPFNPKTRIVYRLPEAGNVKIRVFNTLGQSVLDEIVNDFPPGLHYTDIEMNGLPNGIYFANININDRYSVTKKLLLLYGSNHLSASSTKLSLMNNIVKNENNLFLSTKIDSLAAFNSMIGRKVFKYLPDISGTSTEIGTLVFERFCPGLPTVSYGGKTYNTVMIGSQCWLRENLNIGNIITVNQSPTDNGIIEKYCFLDDSTNCGIYGGLYRWEEAMAYNYVAGAKGICPPGFHIPTLSEYETLKTIVGDDGNTLKDIGQGVGPGEGTNTSGFTGLLAGYNPNDGYYYNLGYNGMIWSSSPPQYGNAIHLTLFLSNQTISLYYHPTYMAFSIRCIKDN